MLSVKFSAALGQQIHPMIGSRRVKSILIADPVQLYGFIAAGKTLPGIQLPETDVHADRHTRISFVRRT